MALTAIIYLQKPYIIASGSSSVQGITTLPKQNLQVGIIEQAYMGSIWLVNTIVLFPYDKTVTITDASGTYFMIDEQYIYYYEAPLP